MFREVTIPESITVQELANRMAERAGDVIKALMNNGIMATITETIDAETAELLVTEFGHTPKRVSESDVEIGLKGDDARLNPNGGAIAVGHPLGASGARLALTGLRQLERINGRYALISLCIGIGQGVAMLIERTPE